MILHLPQEIIEEILYRLPPKSLLRFKSVSKPWCNLISSPKFVKNHLDKSTGDPNFTRRNLIFCSNLYDIKFCSFGSLLQQTSPNIVHVNYLSEYLLGINPLPRVSDSCNGLICIADREAEFLLWNPVIRKLKRLSSPHLDYIRRTRPYPPAYGFGYQNSGDDYRVVSIVEHYGRRYSTQVYSLRADSWKKVDDFPTGFYPAVDGHGIGKFVNGKLYWLSNYNQNLFFIVSYDLMEDKYEKVLPLDNLDTYPSTLAVLGGSLCLLCLDLFKDRCSKVEVWIVESWVKMITIPTEFSDISPICLLNNAEILCKHGSVLTSYNLENNLPTTLRECIVDEPCSVSVFVEGLALPYASDVNNN